MFEKHGERSVHGRSQRGFTLLELLVVIAILGVLGGVAVFGVAKFRATAQKTALDQSLSAVATAVEAQMILENMTDLSEIRPADLPVRNTEGIDFVAFDLTTTSTVVQARFADTFEPCRQIHFPNTNAGPCDSTAGKTLRSFTPGRSDDSDQMAMMLNLAKRDDDAKKRDDRDRQRTLDEEAKKRSDEELNRLRNSDDDSARKDPDPARDDLRGRRTGLEDDINKIENDLADYEKRNQSKIDQLRKDLEAERAKGKDASDERMGRLDSELKKLEQPIEDYRKGLEGARTELDRLDKGRLGADDEGKPKASR